MMTRYAVVRAELPIGYPYHSTSIRQPPSHPAERYVVPWPCPVACTLLDGPYPTKAEADHALLTRIGAR